MKQIHTLLSVLLFVSFTSAYGQCEPDTANCKDINDPGEFCPRQLPAAIINQEYEAVITAITPGSFTLPQGTILIDHIVVDSVTNFPPGISYESSSNKFYADSAYCIRVFGTPTEAGSFPLSIYVTPYINFGGSVVPVDPVKDDTSVVMSVEHPSGIEPDRAHVFRVLPNVPNPFLETTRISFYSPFDQRVELRVYNILGEMLHEESAGFSPGEHSFEYDGGGLQPGTYIYRITNQKEIFTGKFIKARR